MNTPPDPSDPAELTARQLVERLGNAGHRVTLERRHDGRWRAAVTVDGRTHVAVSEGVLSVLSDLLQHAQIESPE
jgi:hypothetical protein